MHGLFYRIFFNWTNMFSFSNVEVSPVISSPLAIFLNNLRIIFPDLVLGHLGEDVFVVSAFQNVGAMHLQEDHSIACDVLVTGNKRAARDTVITLIEAREQLT